MICDFIPGIFIFYFRGDWTNFSFQIPCRWSQQSICSTQNSNVRKYKSWLRYSPIAFPTLCCCRFHSVNIGPHIFYQNLTFLFWPKCLFWDEQKRGNWFSPIEILFIVNEKKKQFGFTANAYDTHHVKQRNKVYQIHRFDK